ncbi:MAG: TIGR04282 family arsenosugar biosynthesis glycosyltransferase [Pseudomonadota bacterium]
MLKEPRPGRVKTRLARDIGYVPAAWWFRHQSSRLIRRLDGGPWRLWLAVTPDREGLMSRVWPGHLPRIAQGRGDLGKRMTNAFLAVPRGPRIIIGADIPGVTPRHIGQAFRVLAGRDAVFGPAMDGGFWLVGVRHRLPRNLFGGVRWSTEHTLRDTVSGIRGARLGYCDVLSDVDEVADLSA